MRKLLFCHPALENKKNQFKEKMGFSYLQELKSKCLTTIIIMTIDRFLVLFALSRLISSKHDFSQEQQLYQMLLAGVTAAANPH